MKQAKRYTKIALMFFMKKILILDKLAMLGQKMTHPHFLYVSTFNEAPDPWPLHLSKIGPDGANQKLFLLLLVETNCLLQ